MAKIKTSELTGPALDWAVAKCEGIDPYINKVWIGTKHCYAVFDPDKSIFQSSTDWSQGGPIIEREGISVLRVNPVQRNWHTHFEVPDEWAAELGTCSVYGPTPLITACRCFVASKLGDEVDVPEELQ